MPEADILFCGDPHGKFQHILDVVRWRRPNAVVMLGDLEPQEPVTEIFHRIAEWTDLYFIHGNHDTDTQSIFDRVFTGEWAGQNIDGRVVEIAGVRVAGLGGVFAQKIWMPPDEPLVLDADGLATKYERPLAAKRYIFRDTYDRLARQRADVLVTHEAPSVHPLGFTAIEELASAMGCRALFHGHQHDALDYRAVFDKYGFAVYGVGLRGISSLDGSQVLAGEKDAERAAWRQPKIRV